MDLAYQYILWSEGCVITATLPRKNPYCSSSIQPISTNDQSNHRRSKGPPSTDDESLGNYWDPWESFEFFLVPSVLAPL